MKAIASRLDIADRMDAMAKKESFITLKDHKDNFENNLPCRLINPAKSEMGRISKQILDGINSKLNKKLYVTFEFYPSISEDLLQRAIRFATIQHTRKSLLFSKDKAWRKKEGPELFDVTIGSYDGAEICEIP